ncbi:g280 [Coccomyxa elongata]
MKPQRQTRSSQHTSHGEILLKGRSLSLIAQPLACVSRQAPKRRASTAAQAGAQWRGGGLKAAPTCEAALLSSGSHRLERMPQPSWKSSVAAEGGGGGAASTAPLEAHYCSAPGNPHYRQSISACGAT